MSDFRIRSSTPFDLAAILEIERENSTAAHWQEKDYAQMWGNPLSDRVGFVAEREGAVVGFLVAREILGEWELENVAVSPELQQQGVGTALIEHLFEVLGRRRGTRLFLEVRESNRAAQKLYLRQGFREIGRRTGYYNDPPEDALLFEKIFDDLSMKMR